CPNAAQMGLMRPIPGSAVCWLLATLVSGAAEAGRTPVEHPGLFILPLFRPPSPQERRAVRHPVIWSAHEAGSRSRAMPPGGPAALACLLDGLGTNDTAALESLEWTLVSDAGQVTRHSLHGQDGDFRFHLSGELFTGRYTALSGSTLIVSSLPARLRVGCQYRAAGLNATVRSDWLLLWDERAEVKRWRNANLHCDRTVYKTPDGPDQTALAVAYSCLGLGDTRLLETAVVAMYAKAGKAGTCSTEAASRESKFKIFSNSSDSGPSFFGVAFGGRIRFGWTLGAGGSEANASAQPGQLEQTETCLCLMLDATLPSSRTVQLHYSIPQAAASASVTVPPQQPVLIVPITLGGLPTEVLLDELPERTAPCLLLCLRPDTAACWHRWAGPGRAPAPRKPPDSQPLSLQLRHSDKQAAGIWTCSAQLYPAASVSYAVSSKPRPALRDPRLPRRTAVLQSQSVILNCSLLGLAQNASAEFDIYASIGAANFSLQKFKRVLPDGVMELSVNVSAISSAPTGAMLLLRCRGAELIGGRSIVDYATVNILPQPEVKSLDACPDSDVPCQADCQSPFESQLRSLGVSISYLFYIYSESGQLERTFSSSGVLPDVRSSVAGSNIKGVLKPICQQFFHHISSPPGQASIGSIGGASKQLDDMLKFSPELWDRPLYGMPQSDDPQGNSRKNSTAENRAGVSSMMYVLISIFGVGGLAIFMAVGIGVNEWKKDVRNADPTLISDDPAPTDGQKSATTASSGGKQAGSKVGQGKAPLGGMGAARQVDQKAAQGGMGAARQADQKVTQGGMGAAQQADQKAAQGGMGAAQQADQNAAPAAKNATGKTP
ncbi:hypothetical protein BOX15_Mlig013896g1, partial [Macrostomum lignano]